MGTSLYNILGHDGPKISFSCEDEVINYSSSSTIYRYCYYDSNEHNTDTSYLFGSSYIGNELKTANMCRQGIPNLSNILHEQNKVVFSFTLTFRILLNRGITQFVCDTDWPVCKTTHSVCDVLKTSYLE